jgi:hypothetical protein
MKKILSVLVMVVIIGLCVPTYTFAEEDNSVKIGDKLILKGGYEAICIGYDEGGRPQYQADFGAPKYLDDLVTPIDTTWHLDNGSYKAGANLFNSYVSDEFVNVTDSDLNSLAWQPQVKVSNVDKSKNKNLNDGRIQLTKQKQAKLLDVDPLNSNYKKNTLEWDYGNGIVRRLRIIEGMQQEYYVITNQLDADFEIKHNISSDTLKSNKPAAWDSDKKSIEIIEDSNHNLKVTKEKTQNVKYPIYIDPDITFTSSASDGYLFFTDSVYNTTRTNATGTVFDAVSSSDVRNSVGYSIARGLLYYNTSVLSGYVITAAVINLYVFSKYDANNESIQIQSGMPTYPHMPMVDADYALTNYVTDANCGIKDITTFNVNAYNSITLDASGLTEINTTGWTKFCLRTTGDINNTTPTGHNEIEYGCYENGAGFRPQLVVTFTATVPAVASVDASNLSTEGARFNATLTDDGSGVMKLEDCDTRFGYCPTATLANLGGTAAGSPISLLPNGVDNDIDVTGLGTFTITLPAGHVGTATSDVCNVVGSPVALVAGANVIDTDTAIGNIKITVTLNAFASFATISDWDTNLGSYYHTDDPFYLDVAGLAVGTQYYYAAQARNSIDTTTTAVERYFTTLITVDDMSQFVGYPYETSIKLNWVKSGGANNTRIRYRTDTYPTSETGADGSIEVYFNTGSSITHSGLTSGTTYYYSAWGETGGTYSTNEINLVMTTSVALTTSTLTPVTTPSLFYQNTDETFLANLEPIYSVINGVADSWGMPRGNMWLSLCMLFMFIVGAGLYIRFHAPSMALLVMSLILGGFVVLHILPEFYIVFVLFMALGSWATRPQGV